MPKILLMMLHSLNTKLFLVTKGVNCALHEIRREEVDGIGKKTNQRGYNDTDLEARVSKP